MRFGVHGVCSTPAWSVMDLHERYPLINFHIGDDLLNGCWIVVGCLVGRLP